MTGARTKVIIVGGDPVIGRSLEVLLQAAGYRTLFLSEPVVGKLGEPLADSQLLVFAPVPSAERRSARLDTMLGLAASMKIPTLELLPANGGEQHAQGEHTVVWPCSIDELKRAIDAALLAR